MRVYRALPWWLQNVATSAYGLWLRHLRRGRVRRHTLRQLRQSQWDSFGEIRRKQLERVRRQVSHAARTVPLYADRLPSVEITSLEDLCRLPILTKEDVRNSGDRLISTIHANQRRREIHTGGTTGKPLTIYCDRETLQRNYAFFARFLEWAGVSDGDRVATFAGRTLISPECDRPPYWRYNAASRQMLYSSYHIAPDTIPQYVESLSQFGPRLIDSYPSSLYPIARFMLEHGIETVRPRAIVTSSETLLKHQRGTIREAFDCPVFDHYGAAEMAAFITQCEAGTYHVNPEFGVVEILTDDGPAAPGEEGEIVATGFINPVMPLIRYATGDRAVRGGVGCECGREMPGVERILGRMDDVIVTPEGRHVGRLDPIFKSISSLYETRIVQDRVDHVRVEVVPGDGFGDEQEKILVDELAARLGPSVGIDVVRRDAIPRSDSGKLRIVESRVGA